MMMKKNFSRIELKIINRHTNIIPAMKLLAVDTVAKKVSSNFQKINSFYFLIFLNLQWFMRSAW